jgi:hypothetical protein
MSWKRRQRAARRMADARAAVEAVEAMAEAAQAREGFEMVNRSDDHVPARPPSEDLVMITTPWGLLPKWKATAHGVALGGNL